MHDLVFSLLGANARAYQEGLTELPGPYLERWILATRDNGVAWIVRRRLIGAQAITCVARGYQEIEHWPLTTYTGRARGGVAIEPEPKAVRLITTHHSEGGGRSAARRALGKRPHTSVRLAPHRRRQALDR